MKTLTLIAIAGLQLIVLGFMAGQREWISRTGHTVYLRTAPVDPRDVMRGDYVRLNYDFSRVPRSLCRGKLAEADFSRVPADAVVYAVLSEDDAGVGRLEYLSQDRPAGGLYLRGRTERSWLTDLLPVHYGLEAYFVEQGKGDTIERGRNREGIQVPLEIRAAVSPAGIAVLKGQRWSALGIGLDVETKQRPNDHGPREAYPASATIRLMNASSNDLAIVDLPGDRSLALLPDAAGQGHWRWAPQDTNAPAPSAECVFVLKPGQVHGIRVNLGDPRWSVLNEDRGSQYSHPTAIAAVRHDLGARFRFEYRPPDASQCRHLPHANLIWHGALPCRAFNAVGRID